MPFWGRIQSRNFFQFPVILALDKTLPCCPPIRNPKKSNFVRRYRSQGRKSRYDQRKQQQQPQPRPVNIVPTTLNYEFAAEQKKAGHSIAFAGFHLENAAFSHIVAYSAPCRGLSKTSQKAVECNNNNNNNDEMIFGFRKHFFPPEKIIQKQVGWSVGRSVGWSYVRNM